MAGGLHAWLDQLGLARYADTFSQNDLDLDLVLELNDRDLRDLGIMSMGHRKRLLRAIEAQRRSSAGAEHRRHQSGHPQVTSAVRAERRQLTVVFTDLVESTALSQALDPEDLRELLRRYQDTVVSIAASHDGFVAKFLGDGALIYFGWPQAFEDQAERAIRTALETVQTIGEISLDGNFRLRARAGIATGEVVVGDIIGESANETDAVVGDTPNLAARLQGQAEPGQVVIDTTTCRLAGNAFEVEALGGRMLKGFTTEVGVWRIAGELAHESRFAAAHQAGLTRFTGRQDELDMLCDRWSRAWDGAGQIVLVAGEAGIGKSRLVEAFESSLARRPDIRWHFQCAPSQTSSALHPVIRHVQRAARFVDGDGNEARLRKLEQLVGTNDREALALLADLVSLAFEHRYGSLEMAPRQRRARTIEALIDLTLGPSADGRKLLIVEDAHWLDPTTAELISEIGKRICGHAALMIVTHRPEWRHAFEDLPDHLTTINLTRLSDGEAHDVVRVVAGPALDERTIAQIAARADGNPLYVEEITKATLEQASRAGPGETPVPATLQSSLLARLDRLGPAKELAQVGAVIGREFDHELLARVAAGREADLRSRIRALIDSGLVHNDTSGDGTAYRFKHALVQDAAYASLLRSRRREIHGLVANALATHFASRVSANPELLAHHHTQARQIEPAIEAWVGAGTRAAARSANIESISHFRQGIDLLGGVRDAAKRSKLELALRAGLGVPLSAVNGPGHRETLENCERARSLCMELAEPPELYRVLWSCWRSNLAIARLDEASELAGQLLEFAQRQDDTGLLLEAHHAQWTTFSRLFEPSLCWHHAEKGNALYERARHHRHVFTITDHDAGVCCRGFGALSLWQLGYPDRALRLSREAVRLARDLAHPTSLAHALTHAIWLYQLRRDLAPILERAQEIEGFASEHGFPQYLATADLFRGWALVRLGRSGDGLAIMHKAYQSGQAKGTGPSNAYFLHLMADAHLHGDDAPGGLALIDDAIAEINRVGTNAFEPELYRIKGELHRSAGDNGEGVAAACFGKALDLAKAKGARSLELRAAASLARLHRDGECPPEATARLARVVQSFDEGRDTADLREAAAVLGQTAPAGQ
jgi:class 3 adenylate cyclase